MPGGRFQIFGFAPGGDIRVGQDALARQFLSHSQEGGFDFAPNLLAALSGLVLSWGELTVKQSGRVCKEPDGKFVLSVTSGGLP